MEAIVDNVGTKLSESEQEALKLSWKYRMDFPKNIKSPVLYVEVAVAHEEITQRPYYIVHSYSPNTNGSKRTIEYYHRTKNQEVSELKDIVNQICQVVDTEI
ncbi:hypothetical protein SAMN05216390_1391 [Lachnospiraceae bacterium KH1T2]|nr:hypothetical protein SAMN05216390_1391 [Lachnospiraceae bacterium KH1T2]